MNKVAQVPDLSNILEDNQYVIDMHNVMDIDVSEDDDEDEDYGDENDAQVLLEFSDPSEQEITFELPNIPGCDLDVDELELDDLDVDEDDNVDVASDPWDWSSKGHQNFLEWLGGMLKSIPQHSGNDTTGIERVIAYLEAIDKEITKAVRTDFRDKIDISKVEMARREILEGLKRSRQRLDKLKGNLYKSAQKVGGVAGGVTITVPLLISRLARVCINGHISGGHSIEDLYEDQVKEYNLDKREQAELMQLIDDMGFPIFRDRGLPRDEEFNPTKSDNWDFAANYPG